MLVDVDPTVMTFASASQFHFYLPWDSVLNVKALVGAFNQEKALVGAFSVIYLKSSRTLVWSSTRYICSTILQVTCQSSIP